MSDDEPAGQLGESVEMGPPKTTTAQILTLAGFLTMVFAVDAVLIVFAIISLWHLPTWAVSLVTLALAFTILGWITNIREMRRRWRALRLARLNRRRNKGDSHVASEGTTSVANGVGRRPKRNLAPFWWGLAGLTLACALGSVVAEWTTPPVGIVVAFIVTAARLACAWRGVSLNTRAPTVAGVTGS